VNARSPTPSAQFSAFLSRFPPAIVALVKKCLPKLRRAFPGCHQLVYDYAHSLVVAFGVSERGYEAIVALAIFPDRVQLYFDKSLPDPNRRLKGAGTKVRSVTVEAASDLDRGDINDLIKAAVKHAGVTFPKTRSTIIIKSVAKMQKAKAAKKKSG
jgi:hypothetical protein